MVLTNIRHSWETLRIQPASRPLHRQPRALDPGIAGFVAQPLRPAAVPPRIRDVGSKAVGASGNRGLEGRKTTNFTEADSAVTTQGAVR